MSTNLDEAEHFVRVSQHFFQVDDIPAGLRALIHAVMYILAHLRERA